NELLAADDGEVQPDLHLDGLAVDRGFRLGIDVPAQAAGAELLHNGSVRNAVDDDRQGNGMIAELGTCEHGRTPGVRGNSARECAKNVATLSRAARRAVKNSRTQVTTKTRRRANSLRPGMRLGCRKRGRAGFSAAKSSDLCSMRRQAGSATR